ncbi:MAG: GAF and ANTAR domain-containing protein, partial [Propionibacteriales bacterium]|nr:GAF and ANTAR domain-containing protein [Propionibacteriales bacterium]
MSANEDSEDFDLAAERAVRVAQSFVTLADTLVDDFDVVDLLDRLVAECVDLLDVSAAGILLMNGQRSLDVMASSDDASRLMEVFQLGTRSGPSIEVMDTGVAIYVADRDAIASRWPSFAHAFSDAGFAAMSTIPMRLREDTIGALNLFIASPQQLSAFDRRLAQAMADVATIGILQHRAVDHVSTLAGQLQYALNSRVSVEQAKGMVAEYAGVDMGQAFEAIRSFSRHGRLKISDVAQSLVER